MACASNGFDRQSAFAYWDSLMLDVGDFIRASGAGTAHVLA